MSIGTTALISNYLGKENNKEAAHIFSQSIILSIFIAIVISILGISFSYKIITTINDDLETLKYSTQYINIIFLGSVFIFILMGINSCLSAQGDTKSYRNVLIISFLLNILLNPILISGNIFGIKLFFPLGISGIAISTILSQLVGIFYLIYKIKKTKIYKHIQFNFFIPNFAFIRNILKQGIPASIGMMMIAIGSYIILFFVAKFGNNAIAGYSAATRYEQLFFLPLLGLSTAVISIVGQNYGSKKYERVKETYYKGLKLGILILTLLGLIIFISSKYAMMIFTSEKEVIDYGSTYLKISAFMFPAFPFFFIGNATFQGLKKAIVVMYMAILRFVIIPLICLSIVIKFKENNFFYIFLSLLLMHLIIALFYFLFTKYKFTRILNINY